MLLNAGNVGKTLLLRNLKRSGREEKANASEFGALDKTVGLATDGS